MPLGVDGSTPLRSQPPCESQRMVKSGDAGCAAGTGRTSGTAVIWPIGASALPCASTAYAENDSEGMCRFTNPPQASDCGLSKVASPRGIPPGNLLPKPTIWPRSFKNTNCCGCQILRAPSFHPSTISPDSMGYTVVTAPASG